MKEKLMDLSKEIMEADIVLLRMIKELNDEKQELKLDVLEEVMHLELEYQETKDKALSTSDKREAKVLEKKAFKKRQDALDNKKLTSKIMGVENAHKKREFEILLKYGGTE